MTEKNPYSILRTSEQVARQIVDYISFENLQAGTRLPTERKLSELLQVSRSSIREGLRVLEILGYVYSKQGIGTFVSASTPYLIPEQVIQHHPHLEQLDHYFEILEMVTEKIIELSNKQNKLQPAAELRLKKPGQNMPFVDWDARAWDALAQWMMTLAERLPNPHYYALWTKTYRFLCENNYFQRKQLSVHTFVRQIIEND